MPGLERAFTEPFTIGRGIRATLHVASGRVSRFHAEVLFEGGGWVLRDAGSTNGTYHDGRRVERVPLADETVVRLGQEGPLLYLSVGAAPVPGEPSAAELAGPGRGIAEEEDTQPHVEADCPSPAGEPTERAVESGGKSATRARFGSPQGQGAHPYRLPVAVAILLLLALAALLWR